MPRGWERTQRDSPATAVSERSSSGMEPHYRFLEGPGGFTVEAPGRNLRTHWARRLDGRLSGASESTRP